MSSLLLQPSNPLTYQLTVCGRRGAFLDVELAVDDGLLAVELVLTRDALEQLGRTLPATIREGRAAARAVAEDPRDDDDDVGYGSLAARRDAR